MFQSDRCLLEAAFINLQYVCSSAVCVTSSLLQIYNDVFGKRAFVIGQVNQVMIKRVGGDVRAVLAMYEKVKVKRKRSESETRAYNNNDGDDSQAPVRVGDRVTATLVSSPPSIHPSFFHFYLCKRCHSSLQSCSCQRSLCRGRA